MRARDLIKILEKHPDALVVVDGSDHSRPATARGGYPLRGGFTSDEERDAAMTAASDDDIAWVRPNTNGKSKGLSSKGYGTRNNLKRRDSVRQQRDREQRAQHPRFVIEHDWAEYPIIRVKPATDQDLAFAREHNVPGYCVPIPPELSDRYAQALAREREASAAVASIEQEIRSYECKQESDPV